MSDEPEISIKRGNDRSLKITVTNDDVAQNITAWIVYFMAKKRLSDPDSKAVINKTVTSHTNAVGGITHVALSDEDTDLPPNLYHFDVKVVDSSGNKQSSQLGILRILPVVKEG